jgi:Cu(I)/Ag(I) efflux system periplasmic protein CusF
MKQGSLSTMTRDGSTAAMALAMVLALAGVMVVGNAQAQAGHGSHGNHGSNAATPIPAAPQAAQAAPQAAQAAQAAPKATPQAAPAAEGEVRRIDAAGGRVTIKHGEIVSLGMPPMTMVFRAKDPSLLQGLKVGDKVRFQAEQDGSNYFLLSVEPLGR